MWERTQGSLPLPACVEVIQVHMAAGSQLDIFTHTSGRGMPPPIASNISVSVAVKGLMHNKDY